MILLPGEILHLKIVREGKDKGQGVGYMPDGTMVVVNNGQSHIGQQVEVEVQSLLQTGAGIIVFAEVKMPLTALNICARANNDHMELVTVYTTFNPTEAQLTRSRLEAANFHPFVADELSALGIEGCSLATGGIRVQVPEAEASETPDDLNPPPE